MGNLIGVGIITCNRELFLQQLIGSLPQNDYCVIVNDGEELSDLIKNHSSINKIIQHNKRKGIAYSKNEAITELMRNKCNHIFIFEDDIACETNELLEDYIHASEKSGILHFNYAFHGFGNKTQDGKVKIRKTIEYDSKTSICFYYNLTAALSYYNRTVIENVGLMDTVFNNVFEHVDYTYRIIKKGFHPPFRWFADIKNSNTKIKELDFSLNNSINSKSKYPLEIRKRIFSLYFGLKHGVRIQNIIDTDEDKFLSILASIQQKNKVQ